MAHWQIRKARYPADPSKPWLAIPAGSLMRARRFATFDQARQYVAAKQPRRKEDDKP